MKLNVSLDKVKCDRVYDYLFFLGGGGGGLN